MDIAKIMVFKEAHELPVGFKHLEGYIPAPREKVVIMDQETIGSELYLSIRFSKGRRVKLNARHFITIQADRDKHASVILK
jgi:hypothetical protein